MSNINTPDVATAPQPTNTNAPDGGAADGDIDIAIDSNIAAQMGFSSFGMQEHQQQQQGRKRGRDYRERGREQRGWVAAAGRGGRGGGYGYRHGGGSESGYGYNGQDGQVAEGGSEVIETGTGTGGDDGQELAQAQTQQGAASVPIQVSDVIPGLPSKPDFVAAVGSNGENQERYIWDSLRQGGAAGGGTGRRGRDRGSRGRGRGNRGGGGGEFHVQVEREYYPDGSYYSSTFVEDPWRRLRGTE